MNAHQRRKNRRALRQLERSLRQPPRWLLMAIAGSMQRFEMQGTHRDEPRAVCAIKYGYSYPNRRIIES